MVGQGHTGCVARAPVCDRDHIGQILPSYGRAGRGRVCDYQVGLEDSGRHVVSSDIGNAWRRAPHHAGPWLEPAKRLPRRSRRSRQEGVSLGWPAIVGQARGQGLGRCPADRQRPSVVPVTVIQVMAARSDQGSINVVGTVPSDQRVCQTDQSVCREVEVLLPRRRGCQPRSRSASCTILRLSR